MSAVAIISKPQKPELQALLPELVLWLRARQFDPVLDPVSGNYTQAARIVPRHLLPEENPELVIVLGGDGTLLSAARVFAKTGTPILSVNLGSLGFLTEVRLADLYSTLEGWCTRCFTTDTRWMLHTELWRDGKLYSQHEALNDVVVAKGTIARMGDFRVMLNDQLAAAFRADGVIVSTPTGSTAYSLAANGPILMPNVDAMIVTPICPHLLTIRPMVVPGDAQLALRIEGIPDQTYLTVDGQEAVPLKVGDELRCRRSQYNVKLVRLGSAGFFDVLRAKLKWGER
ncbi:NAD(+)/NADH kinase [Silvibacterium dinghuense]|uniref:NAD kinase n=1 Tax=Silvibacterium dinghuense TaxID=1560006 RepID=A0A4Q1SG85_9BACT|nr:NAD(+)/NADH kinase [Silvibacterium dinghuense]RXS96536.1 NAD(+)/NADH kinase [Silvibacterium dinghuense]GGG91600.1 NAD kinase [Silvibacterium dinghuense]